MKRIFWLALILGLGITGFWALVRHQMLVVSQNFLSEQKKFGGGGRVSAGGFPGQFEVTFQDLVIIDPSTGTQLESPWFRLTAPTWKPWHLVATGSTARLLGRESVALDAGLAVVEVALTPDTSLSLNEIWITGRHWRAVSDRGWVVQLDNLDAAAQQVDLARYHLQVAVVNLIPDPAISATLFEIGLAGPIESLSVDAHLTFAAPIDRHLGAEGPQLTDIDLKNASLNWGASALAASGQLTTGPDGFASGQVTLDITRPQDLIAAAQAVGLMTKDQAGFLEKGLTVYADPGRADTVKLTFTFAEGQVKLGPFPLGLAPRLN